MSLLMLIITFIPMMLISVFMPYITRKTESFGVSIPEEFYGSLELIQMRKRYVIQTTILSVLVLVVSIILFWLDEKWFEMIIFIALALFLLGSFIIYLLFHNQMKKVKAGKEWNNLKAHSISIDTKFHQKKKTFSNAWFIIPFLITISTFVMTMIFYKKIPESIPMKYDFKGNVTNWNEKSYSTVLQLPIIQLFMTGLFLYINIMISKSKQQINAANPEKSLKQNIVFRQRWSMFTIISGTLIVGLFFLIQLSFIIDLDISVLEELSLGIVAVIILGSIIISVMTGQGGSRVKTNQNENNNLINYDDDRYWKLGVFYFNPNDPSVWVEKRFGSGWTINMARPIGWIVLIIIILTPLIIMWLT